MSYKESVKFEGEGVKWMSAVKDDKPTAIELPEKISRESWKSRWITCSPAMGFYTV